MSRFFSYFFVCILLELASSAQTLPDKSSPPQSTPITGSKTAQEALVFDRLDNHIRYEDDGTGSRESTAVVRVQSQAGVQAMGQLIFGYSSATEKLEIVYVRVRKPDGKVIETSTTDAQDFAPEVLREAPTYSDYRQRHVSVASLQAGDVLEYDVIIHVTTALAPHEFWFEHSFSKTTAVREETLEIDVPKSRELKLKSPERKFETTESGDRRIYSWKVSDFVPDRKRQREEEFVEPDFTPDVQISTFADWQQVGRWYAKLQGDRVVVDDAVRKKAGELTRGATTPLEKTHRLYDFVDRNIRYVSISFGVGRLQPHAASEALKNGYGDCKDKHTLLQSLLKAEGIQSYPVLINSFRDIDTDIPSPGQFDHEITAVDFGGELTWLDATAEVAPYGLIMYQLRGKQALLASDGKFGGLQLTPANSPVKNQVMMKLDGKFSETGAFDTKVDISAQGDNDLQLRGAFRSIPESQWEDMLRAMSSMWGLAGDVSDVHMDSLEDTSKPFHLVYHYHKDNYFPVPNRGINFRLLPPVGLARLPAANRKKALKPLRVGPAREDIYSAHILLPSNYTIQLPPAMAISRDYGDYSISYDLSKNSLDAERRINLKVNELPASRRNDYESFQNVASSAVEQLLTASIKPASAAAQASAAQASGTPEELQKAGNAAIQRRDFGAAAGLFKRAVEGEPSLKNGWNDLGRAYASLNQHDDAIRAFRKQIELDAFHESANQYLAAELQHQGKLDEAAAAYRKQLEITPSNKSTHTSLGLLLAQMNRDAEAKTELEAAAALPPDDPEAKMALARIYSRTGDKEKAEELMKSVTGASSSNFGTDLYAAALRDDIDPNQTIRDARKTLDDIGDEFDSGEYEHLGPSAFHAMDLVALAWARIGWAKFLQGEGLEAIRFLEASWQLSQSGTVENRLARVMEKTGQNDKALRAYALAAAAGGNDAASSKEQLVKLSPPGSAEKALSKTSGELLQLRSVKLPALVSGHASAHFALVFEGSSKPDRAEWLDGDETLRAVRDKLLEKEYPVRFPDVSSVKVIRTALVSCDGSACTAVLSPLEGFQPQK